MFARTRTPAPQPAPRTAQGEVYAYRRYQTVIAQRQTTDTDRQQRIAAQAANDALWAGRR